MERHYWKVMLGSKSSAAQACAAGGFLGADYEIHQDLSNSLPENYREFNAEWIPYFMHSRDSRVSAGLAAGQLWTVCRGIGVGDFVLSPTGTPGELQVGEVSGEYYYAPEGPLPHRRPVTWRPTTLHKESMSSDLRSGLGYGATVCSLDKYSDELAALLRIDPPPIISSIDPDVEDPSVFALEQHLEDFLIANWAQTELAHRYRIFEEDGQITGKQYMTDTGPLDILALSHDGNELLVIELKRGRASDRVVGQIQRYMGFVKEVLAEPHQAVRGVIIALEDDAGLRRALSVAPGIEFYRYKVSFQLEKVT